MINWFGRIEDVQKQWKYARTFRTHTALKPFNPRMRHHMTKQPGLSTELLKTDAWHRLTRELHSAVVSLNMRPRIRLVGELHPTDRAQEGKPLVRVPFRVLFKVALRGEHLLTLKQWSSVGQVRVFLSEQGDKRYLGTGE